MKRKREDETQSGSESESGSSTSDSEMSDDGEADLDLVNADGSTHTMNEVASSSTTIPSLSSFFMIDFRLEL